MRGVSLIAGYDSSRCDLCGSSATEPVLRAGPPALTSDERIVDEALGKVACLGCGLVRNAAGADAGTLTAHYTAYELGAAAAVSEPIFFTADGPMPRSQVIFQWIHRSAMSVLPRAPMSVVEIGCGEGSTLRRFAGEWPSSAVRGLDLSPASVAAARASGLDAVVGSYRELQGRHDLIYAFAVVEHLPSPADFVAAMSERLTEDGVLVVAQPCQDKGCNDVFLVDHLYHFLSRHVSEYGRRAGLVERLRVVGQPLIPDFSLHVFSRHGEPAPPAGDTAGALRAVIDRWQAAFTRVNDWLAAGAARPLAVWGVGYTFQMLRAYSRLRDYSITIGVDDNAARFAGRMPFPVAPLEAAAMDSRARVLLTFVPGAAIVDRLQARRLEWFSPFMEPTV